MQFENHFGGLDYSSEITAEDLDLCGDCAIDFMETKIRSQEGYVEDDDDNKDSDGDSGETLSVTDAADIWMSNGKDEDYTFGYTVEELQRAADAE